MGYYFRNKVFSCKIKGKGIYFDNYLSLMYYKCGPWFVGWSGWIAIEKYTLHTHCNAKTSGIESPSQKTTTTTIYFNEVVFPSVLGLTSPMAFPQHSPPSWPVPSIFPTKSLLSHIFFQHFSPSLPGPTFHSITIYLQCLNSLYPTQLISPLNMTKPPQPVLLHDFSNIPFPNITKTKQKPI